MATAGPKAGCRGGHCTLRSTSHPERCQGRSELAARGGLSPPRVLPPGAWETRLGAARGQENQYTVPVLISKQTRAAAPAAAEGQCLHILTHPAASSRVPTQRASHCHFLQTRLPELTRLQRSRTCSGHLGRGHVPVRSQNGSQCLSAPQNQH